MSLIILDRDGVINEDFNRHVRHVDDWHPIPGSIEAMAKLYHAGFTLVIMTNQSGIARGYFEESELQAMHDKMIQLLAEKNAKVAGIYYCPHHPDDGCDCRKPAPGMIQQIARDFPDFSLSEAVVIGDSWRDIRAGKTMGCQTILVQTGKGPLSLMRHQHELGDTRVVQNLAAAAKLLLEAIA